MKIKDFIAQLQKLPQDSEIYHSKDDEMNVLSFATVDEVTDAYGKMVYAVFPNGVVNLDEVL